MTCDSGLWLPAKGPMSPPGCDSGLEELIAMAQEWVSGPAEAKAEVVGPPAAVAGEASKPSA